MKKYFKKNHYAPTRGIRISMPSATVPSQSYTIRELISRAQAGLVNLNLGYETGDDDTFDTTVIDDSDFFETGRQITQKTIELQELVNKQKDEFESKRVLTELPNNGTASSSQTSDKQNE